MCGNRKTYSLPDIGRLVMLLGMVPRLLCSAMTAAQTLPSEITSVQTLPPELQAAWRATGLPESSLSLYVQEVGGDPLVAINESEPRNPASVMKMVTTWAGLLALGAGYKWRTTVMANQTLPNADRS